MNLLIPVAILVLGLICGFAFLEMMFTINYFRQALFLASSICLVIGFGWLYAAASGGLPKSKLKLLDWTLIGFIMCMIPIFEILALPLMFWIVMVVAPSIIARLIITWWINRNRRQ